MTSPPPPVYGPPPRPLPWQSPGVIMAVVTAVALVMASLVFAFTGFGFGGFPFIFFAPFCAFVVIIVIVIVAVVSQTATRSAIPPPPPIQGPMVPAGQVGPVGLNCPNCGAPPQNVDRFGVATCTYCNTRFLVR